MPAWSSASPVLRTRSSTTQACWPVQALASINKTQLSAFPVLLPPLAEQEKFKRQVEAVEAIVALQDAAARKAEATFGALLASAFNEAGPQVHREMEKALA